MKHQQTTRLSSQEQEQAQAAQQSTTQAQGSLEFASADAMLRHDAEQMPVPPAVAERLQQSIKQEEPPPQSWWQRLFSK